MSGNVIYTPSKFKLFSLPNRNVISSGNDQQILRITPRNGSTYYSDRNDVIEFNLATNHELIDPKSIAIKGKFQSSTYTAGPVCISGLGAPAVFKRIEVEAAGHKIEDIDRYNLLTASSYHYASDEQRKVLEKLEGYIGTVGTLNSTGGSLATSGSIFVHHPVNGLFNQDKLLPGFAFKGGLNIKCHLENQSNVVLDTSGNFKLSDVELICKTQATDINYQNSVYAGLDSGRAIQIPFKRFKQFTKYGNAAQEIDINIPTSYASSVREIWVRCRDTTTLGTQTYDKFLGKFTSSSLESYYLIIENKQFPQGKPIQYLAYSDNTLYDPESTFHAYVDDNQKPITFNDADFFLKVKLSEPEFASGVSTLKDGSLTLHLKAKSGQTFASTSAFDIFCLVDAQLEITNNMITTYERI